MMSAVCCVATPSNAMSNHSFGLTSQHNLSRMANHNYYSTLETDKLLLPQTPSYSSTHLQTALQNWNSTQVINNSRSNAATNITRCSQGQAAGSTVPSSCNRTRILHSSGLGNQPDEHMSSKHGQHMNAISSGLSNQHWSQRHQGSVNSSSSSTSSHNGMVTEELSVSAAPSSRGSSLLSMSTLSASSSTSTSSAWQLTLSSMSSDAVFHASRRLAASSSLFQSGQASNQVNSGIDPTAAGSNANNATASTIRAFQAGAAGPAQSTNRSGLLSNSSSNRHRRTCSETFLVPDACLASSLSRSRRLQSNHKRLEEALTEAIPSASSGRVSQRIAQLQQSLYACSWNSAPAVSSNPVAVPSVASSSNGRVSNSLPSSLTRPLSIDPKKDYSLPLNVDCSIEYDLPRVARPPPGAQPLLLIARRAPTTSAMQSVGWRKLQQPVPNYTYAFQQSQTNSHLPHSHTIRPEMAQAANARTSRSVDECGSAMVSGTSVMANVSNAQVLQQQQPLRLNNSTASSGVGANNTVFHSMSAMTGMMHDSAPVSSSSSDSGRGTDSERNSPGSAFCGPALMNSRSSSHKRQSSLPQSGGRQMSWNHIPAPPMDSGLGLDVSSSSWMAASHLAMRSSAMNRSLVAGKPSVRASSTSSTSAHHGHQVQQPTLVPRLPSGAGTEAAQQRLGANEPGVAQCQCCQRPQQEALAKSAPALASMAVVPPRWAPYSTHIRHVCPPTAQHQQHQQYQQLQQLQHHEQLKVKEKPMLGTGDTVAATTTEWNTWNIQNNQTFVMPRSMAAFQV